MYIHLKYEKFSLKLLYILFSNILQVSSINSIFCEVIICSLNFERAFLVPYSKKSFFILDFNIYEFLNIKKQSSRLNCQAHLID